MNITKLPDSSLPGENMLMDILGNENSPVFRSPVEQIKNLRRNQLLSIHLGGSLDIADTLHKFLFMRITQLEETYNYYLTLAKKMAAGEQQTRVERHLTDLKAERVEQENIDKDFDRVLREFREEHKNYQPIRYAKPTTTEYI